MTSWIVTFLLFKDVFWEFRLEVLKGGTADVKATSIKNANEPFKILNIKWFFNIIYNMKINKKAIQIKTILTIF